EQIRADDEELVRVECFSRADHAVPPAEPSTGAAIALIGAEAVSGTGGRGRGREAGGVSVSAQRMTDQNDIVAGRRQRPVRLVGNADPIQFAPAVEGERFRKVEELCVDGTGGSLRRWRGHRNDHNRGWSCGGRWSATPAPAEMNVDVSS